VEWYRCRDIAYGDIDRVRKVRRFYALGVRLMWTSGRRQERLPLPVYIPLGSPHDSVIYEKIAVCTRGYDTMHSGILRLRRSPVERTRDVWLAASCFRECHALWRTTRVRRSDLIQPWGISERQLVNWSSRC
jgi:hypothetical protein